MSPHTGMLLCIKAEAGRKQQGPAAVILSPTRELAAQSHRALKLLLPGTSLRGSLLCKATVAGTDFSRVDMLIATPLLLVQTIQGHKVSLHPPSNHRWHTVPPNRHIQSCEPI